MTKLAAVGKTLEDYNYENEDIADIILSEIADVQFMGMSVSWGSKASFSLKRFCCDQRLGQISKIKLAREHSPLEEASLYDWSPV